MGRDNGDSLESRKRAIAENSGGTCHERAYRSVMLLGGRFRLAHGFATGTGPIEGIRYSHAWLENGSVVVDVGSLDGDKPKVIEKEAYYEIGNINESEVRTYSKEEAFKMATEHMTLGHWHETPNDVVWETRGHDGQE